MATNYSINYEDERFKDVERQEADKLKEVDNTYNEMINQSDKYYQDQINASKDYVNTQQDLQNQNTQLIVDEINQQKEFANKDYTKEQKGAYVDWRKQSNEYGAEAEQMASSGLQNTGYSESSQVSMYNQYQNRVATARESYNRAIVSYDNAIKEARLQNSSKLAELAYNGLQAQLELSLQGFQYKNTLLQTQLEAKRQVEQDYYTRWQNVLSQMNTENALAEQVRQYNENKALQEKQLQEQIRQYNEKMAYQKQRDAIADAQWQKEYNLAAAAKASSSGSSGGSYTYSGGSSSSSKKSSTKTSSSGTYTPYNRSTTVKGADTATYNKLLSSVRTLYNASRINKVGAAEDMIAIYLSKGQINEAQAQKMLKTLGIKK